MQNNGASLLRKVRKLKQLMQNSESTVTFYNTATMQELIDHLSIVNTEDLNQKLAFTKEGQVTYATPLHLLFMRIQLEDGISNDLKIQADSEMDKAIEDLKTHAQMENNIGMKTTSIQPPPECRSAIAAKQEHANLLQELKIILLDIVDALNADNKDLLQDSSGRTIQALIEGANITRSKTKSADEFLIEEARLAAAAAKLVGGGGEKPKSAMAATAKLGGSSGSGSAQHKAPKASAPFFTHATATATQQNTNYKPQR
jgi:hypothetical protein